LDLRLEYSARCIEANYGGPLTSGHQPRISLGIRRQDRCQPLCQLSTLHGVGLPGGSRMMGYRAAPVQEQFTHIRHDLQTKARAAHSPELSGEAPFDGVLARAECRRRAPEDLVADAAEARVEVLLRAAKEAEDGFATRPWPLTATAP
jgi:hypothetical protein